MAVVIVVGVAGVAAAAPWGGRFAGFGGVCGGFGGAGKGGFGQPGQAVANMIKELDLTDEQISQVRKIQAETFEKMQALQTSMSQKMFELKDLYWQKEPDQNAITAKQTEITELRKQMSTIQQQVQDQMKNVLTEEQQDKLAQLRGAGRGKRGGRRMGGFNGTPAPGGAGTTSN
ncbi:MAG: hypothetical protein HPY55_04685 [Firmicutes bacterium]|nr:hypothetical protein [Bacillota bacterium]